MKFFAEDERSGFHRGEADLTGACPVAPVDGTGVANVKYITYFLCNCEIFYTIMRPGYCGVYQR